MIPDILGSKVLNPLPSLGLASFKGNRLDAQQFMVKRHFHCLNFIARITLDPICGAKQFTCSAV